MFADIVALKEDENRHHFMATVVGLKQDVKTIITDQYEIVDVVDGQQRLTTLVILLKAIEKRLLDNPTPNQELSLKLHGELKELLVKSDDLSLLLLQTNHDTSHLFTDYLRSGKQAELKSAMTLADREITKAITDCEKFVASFGDVVKLTSILKNRLNFIFHEIADEAAVYKVFGVLNSRGLPVPWIDRLKSALMGVVFERKQGNSNEIIGELHQIWGDIYRAIGLRQGLNSETLKFAATLKDRVRRSRVLGEEQSVALFKTMVGDDPVKAVESSKWILRVAQAVDQFMQTSRRSKAVSSIAHARLVAVSIIGSSVNLMGT